MTSMRDLLAYYREIEKAATPGPWHEESEGPEVQAIYGPKGAFHHVLWARICDACAKHGGTCTAASPADSALLTTARNIFAALLDVAEAAARIQREAAAAGWGDAAGWDMAELNAPMQSNDKALDRLREAMEANRG